MREGPSTRGGAPRVHQNRAAPSCQDRARECTGSRDSGRPGSLRESAAFGVRFDAAARCLVFPARTAHAPGAKAASPSPQPHQCILATRLAVAARAARDYYLESSAPLRLSFPKFKRSAVRPFVAGEASAEAQELQAKMAAHGHLFFRSLLPRDSVLEARAEALALCREAGWIVADSSRARWSGCEPVAEDDPNDPRWREFYQPWINSPQFRSLAEHPAVVAVAEKLLGDTVLVHQRKIGRFTFPQNEGHRTRVHQDFHHVRGTPETYTAWVPLGDCPMQLGSLIVADGSHKLGFREHQPSSGPGGFSVEADAHAVWRGQDFKTGDVLFFHSYLMHQALPNKTRDELRISIDNRYQRADDEIDPGSLRPHIEPAELRQ